MPVLREQPGPGGFMMSQLTSRVAHGSDTCSVDPTLPRKPEDASH